MVRWWSNNLLKWLWNLNFGPTLIIYSTSIPQQSMYFTQKIDVERSFIKLTLLNIWAENRWTGQEIRQSPSSSPGSVHGGKRQTPGLGTWASALRARAEGVKGTAASYQRYSKEKEQTTRPLFPKRRKGWRFCFARMKIKNKVILFLAIQFKCWNSHW